MHFGPTEEPARSPSENCGQSRFHLGALARRTVLSTELSTAAGKQRSRSGFKFLTRTLSTRYPQGFNKAVSPGQSRTCRKYKSSSDNLLPSIWAHALQENDGVGREHTFSTRYSQAAGPGENCPGCGCKPCEIAPRCDPEVIVAPVRAQRRPVHRFSGWTTIMIDPGNVKIFSLDFMKVLYPARAAPRGCHETMAA